MQVGNYPTWVHEQSSTHRGVRTSTLILVMLVALFLAMYVLPRAAADPDGEIARRQACADLERYRAMGLPHGSNYRVLVRNCHGELAGAGR